MNETGQRGSSKSHRVLGEDAPRWLTLGFGVVGSCIAVAAAWLLLAQGPRLQEQKTQGGAVVEQAAAVSPRTESHPAAPLVQTPPPPTTTQAAQALSPIATTQAPPAPEQRTAAPVAPVAPAVAPAAESAAVAVVGKPDMQPPVGNVETLARLDCPALITVPFKFDSSLLSQGEVVSSSAALIEALQRHPEAKLYVQGYADSAGWDQYNLLLSYRRAKTVVALLNKAGVPAQRIIIRAAGSHEPVEGMPADAGANRRVTLQVTGVAGCK